MRLVSFITSSISAVAAPWLMALRMCTRRPGPKRWVVAQSMAM
jgi:hypothetical protein